MCVLLQQELGAFSSISINLNVCCYNTTLGASSGISMQLECVLLQGLSSNVIHTYEKNERNIIRMYIKVFDF